MTRTHYLISISAKGILPDAKPSFLDELEQRFGPLQEVHGSWPLSQEGIDEKIYKGSRPETHPLTPQEVEELKTLFDAEKRILEVYRLEKM